jgi:hypothetical protein
MLQLYGSAHLVYKYCASAVREAYPREGSGSAHIASGSQVGVQSAETFHGHCMQVWLWIPEDKRFLVRTAIYFFGGSLLHSFMWLFFR